MLKIKDNVDLKELEKYELIKEEHYDLFKKYEYKPSSGTCLYVDEYRNITIFPNKIKYKNNIYEYDGETLNYFRTINFAIDFLIGEDITALLNDEIEIIEEDKKIKKLEFEGGEIEDELFLARYITHNRAKINELIDEVNNLKGEKYHE